MGLNPCLTTTSRKSEKKKQALTKSGNPQKALFTSPVVTTDTPGHAVQIKAKINGVRNLFLTITDAGNYSHATGQTGPSPD